MTLKEEIEILRGALIEINTVKPEDVPCIESSDPEKLCRHPMVSVLMATYNHEPYIRQAIEGVMMQKTDFEFELIIGEDCSPDKTREICFEYQRRYPDKIRVLWWHENVSKLGGNGGRMRVRCRGELIAICEGDDFWTDPYKLQKQVDVFRKHPTVNLCFGGVDILYQRTGVVRKYLDHAKRISGMVKGADMIRSQLDVESSVRTNTSFHDVQTSGLMVRTADYFRSIDEDEVFNWQLLLGDKTLRLALAVRGDTYFLAEPVSCYRINSTGVTKRRFADLMRDDFTVRVYFAVKLLGMTFEQAVRLQEKGLVRTWVNNAAVKSACEQRKMSYDMMQRSPLIKEFFRRPYALPLLLLMRLGLLTPRLAFYANRIYWHMPRFWLFK